MKEETTGKMNNEWENSKEKKKKKKKTTDAGRTAHLASRDVPIRNNIRNTSSHIGTQPDYLTTRKVEPIKLNKNASIQILFYSIHLHECHLLLFILLEVSWKIPKLESPHWSDVRI
jgi:hypothetical protein